MDSEANALPPELQPLPKIWIVVGKFLVVWGMTASTKVKIINEPS